ncbi:cell division protein FtsQ/DivIB [Terriglobus aquaticus]|uniref:Cell division protein FtsQ n=1 Tax=Terriglobus aquaticus TaxID=940139 RepID=A0ABW9KLX4_9BACT|nr:FtsQ-type POTRA domain-containing protein [Terriglobus aquaticus]
MPEDTSREKPRARRSADVRRAAADTLPARRERPGVPGDPYADDDTREYLRSRTRGKRIRRGLIPQSKYGRIAAGVGLAAFLASVAGAAYFVSRFVHRDPQFTIASSSAIELQGNQHLSRSQLLSVFGEDVDRNIFDVPLAERKEELEQIPWVEHATVMRLLPNHLRISVVERTPIAFVRQGGTIGMADASGVLLDIPPDAPGNPNYSFPVVTGLKPDDTPESRSQRMHLYAAFLKDLDSGGKKISAELSEVDLSDPEDVKALLPSNNSETMVHFGTEQFLARYNRFQEHITEWRQQYPRLSSVDMRYERQVVLQMPPRDSTVPTPDGKTPADTAPAAKSGAIPTVVARAAAPVREKPSQVATVSLPKPPHAEPRAAAVHETRPAVAHVEPHARPVAQAKHPDTKRADVAKRVEAIKAWMAQRQAARDAARAHAAQ